MAQTLIVFVNNATSTLALPLSSTASTAQLAAGTGVLFPTPANGQYFPLTFVQPNGILSEIVYVTGLAGDTITAMTRGEEGTAAQAFAAGCVVQALITAGSLNTIVAAVNTAGAGPTNYTFANLPDASVFPLGWPAFCTDGCNIGELTGAGTGTPVFVKAVSGLNTWCAQWSGIAVTA